MAPVINLSSLFELACPRDTISPDDIELPFIVEGVESFPNSEFEIEVRKGHDLLASCSIDDGSISLQAEVLQDLTTAQSSSLQMRLVPYSGGYALAETSISIHPFYKIHLGPDENGIRINIPAEYSSQFDNRQLQITSTFFAYEPQSGTIERGNEEEFGHTNSRYHTLSFGSRPSEYNIAVLIRIVDGPHRREEYFPIRKDPLILGNIHLSNTQLLKGEVPDVPQVEFIHHPNMPPEANRGVYEFQPTEGGRGLNTRPVVFNRAKWEMTSACTEGTCNQFGIKVYFSSVDTDDDYLFLYEQGFFENLETVVSLNPPFEDSQQLSATQDGLECVLLPTLRRDIKSLIGSIYDQGLNKMIRVSSCEKVHIQLGRKSIESPSRLNSWNLDGEMFEFVCDDRGRFQHIRFINGMPCTQHDAVFFFVVNNQILYPNEKQDVQWVNEWEHTFVKFPNIAPPLGEVEVKARLPRFGSKPQDSISLGVWNRE